MPRHIIMDASGHTTINFDTASLTDLVEAKRRFHTLIAVSPRFRHPQITE